ncbi:hypothetical protein FEK35_19105 [Nocardia cyriacigeorgica]|uniref:Uncharacterized protein n=1 Tax=Nocardia cyriacigeorgica TaxID=135487 RepID=A0A5R8PBQ7_9NOCA|nr:hypothetical protein [Nocardia cyriacigeorgica]TLG05851.1 hypothetical protein FEK35_19105 [Nocardia cyriacigeorgica]
MANLDALQGDRVPGEHVADRFGELAQDGRIEWRVVEADQRQPVPRRQLGQKVVPIGIGRLIALCGGGWLAGWFVGVNPLRGR